MNDTYAKWDGVMRSEVSTEEEDGVGPSISQVVFKSRLPPTVKTIVEAQHHNLKSSIFSFPDLLG